MMPGPEETARNHARKRRRLVAAGTIVVVALAAVYGIGTFSRNAGDASCAPAVALAQRLAPLARGEVAAFAVAGERLRLPDLAFRDAAGSERRLADWRGRTVLFNLWATWCVPCRKEMPALDALEARLGGAPLPGGARHLATRAAEETESAPEETGEGPRPS